MYQRFNIWRNLNYPVLLIYLALSVIGWLCIFSSTSGMESTEFFSLSNRAFKQLIWIGISFTIGILILIIPEDIYELIAYLAYGLVLVLLLITPFFAHNIKGSYSWLTIGSFSFQPAELAKITTALALAKFMSKKEYDITKNKMLFQTWLFFLFPIFIVAFWQRESGTALVYAAFIGTLYCFGMTKKLIFLLVYIVILSILSIILGNDCLNAESTNLFKYGFPSGIASCILSYLCCAIVYLLVGDKRSCLWLSIICLGVYAISYLVNMWIAVPFGIITIALVLFIVLFAIIKSLMRVNGWNLLCIPFVILSIAFSYGVPFLFDHLPPHQRNRVEVALHMKNDLSGIGYNVNQAKIAISSGQWTGKGLFKGTQTKLQFIPEQDTDFIFCTVGEEGGFLGCLIVIGLYSLLVGLGIKMIQLQKNRFEQIYGTSVVCIFIIHLIINIGMVIGILPVIGIPLPFLSYGGSSFLAFTILLFILLKFDAMRTTKL